MTGTIGGFTSPLGEKDGEIIRTPLGSIHDSHVYVLIILVACIVFGKSVFYQYTYYDDTRLLVVNQKILSNFANIPKLFQTDVFLSVASPQLFYRPFLNLVFMVELHISSGSTEIFHITNILLHIGCSILLFIVFQQLGVSKPIAAATALLFCAHPLNASAVVWIPGRNDTLLTFLVLASFSLFLRALETKNIFPLIGHLLLFFLALLTKESAIVLPLFSLGYMFFVRKEHYGYRTNIVTAVGYAASLTLWYFLRSMVTGGIGMHESLVAFVNHVTKNSPSLVLYIGKAFLPFNLSVFPNLTDHSLVLGIVTIFCFLAILLIRKPLRYREIAWGLIWSFLFLAPTLISGVIRYEHRAYCSFIGLLFAIVHLSPVRSLDFSKKTTLLGFVAILTLYSLLAMLHSEHFHNRTAFATTAYVKDPSVDASAASLADLFLDEGNNEAAEHVLQAAIAREPDMKFVHRLLGDVYANRQEYTLAAKEYETSIRVDPLQVYAYIDYGKMCMKIGQNDKAARLWKQSVVINPEFIIGYEYLATFYAYVKNDPDSAMIYARQIQQHGSTVMPELLAAIMKNPLYGRKNQ